MSIQSLKIGFIGGGNIAQCLIAGLITSGHNPKQIIAFDHNDRTRKLLVETYPITIAPDNQILLRDADLVLLCTKPQGISALLQSIAPYLRPDCPLATVIAGCTLETYQAILGAHPIIRCMPNIAARVQASTTMIYAPATVSAITCGQVESIMRSVGSVHFMSHEEDLHLTTALAGSGPGFFLRMLEGFSHAAQQLDMPEDQAALILLETLSGTAKLALSSGQSITSLRTQVTSPQGITAAGLAVMETQNIDELLAKVIQTACQRSKELSNPDQSLTTDRQSD